MKWPIILSFLFSTITAGAQQDYYLITGTYTSGKSEGIYVYRLNMTNGESSQVFVARGIKNPSFLVVSPDEKFVYAVEEINGNGNAGRVFSYRFNKADGSLTMVNDRPSGGDDPCYITVDTSGRWVIVGNYSSGSLSVLPVSTDGVLGEPVTRIAHSGSSINKERQAKPHVHSTVLNRENTFLYVPDLGIDKVMIYGFDNKTGNLVPAAVPYAEISPGTGPRHFDFYPGGHYAYLVGELTGTVTAFWVNKKNGSLQNLHAISTAKPRFTGFMGSADIHVSPDGKFVYASNRGDANDIAIFKTSKSGGRLSYIGSQDVLGKTPRNFTIDPTGSFLLVANQETNEIVIFNRNKKTGLLHESGKRIQVPNPVCLKWVKL